MAAAPLLQRLRADRLALTSCVAASLALAGAMLAYRWSEREGMQRVTEIAAERMELYAAALDSELGRLAHLPALVAIDEHVIALLEAGTPATPGGPLRLAAERQLARLNARAHSLLIYVTGPDGQLLASSEATPLDQSRTLALQQAALALLDQPYGFFAAGSADAGTDFFLAQPVQREGRLLGSIVVVNNLVPLEATWTDLGVRSLSERLMVVDRDDVVILSSVPHWRYRSLRDDILDARAMSGGSPRYPEGRLDGLGMTSTGPVWQGAQHVQLLGDETPNQPYLALQRALPTLGLRLVTLSDPDLVWREARQAGWGGAAAAGLVGLLGVYLIYRRQSMGQLMRARNALQAARDDLEQQVQDRTRELVDANTALKQQIEQRLQVEDELLQAGKLAVLGQMSAGLAHEINQPLTALQALSSNSQRLLQAGRVEDVAQNLKSVAQAVDRMGRITRQLKTFARKADGSAGTASLADAVGNTLLLLGHRLGGITISVEVDPALRVRCDTTRLEQVLVNLIGNAVDAMTDAPLRRLQLTAVAERSRVRVQVIDTGRGLSQAQQARLFEPFFTTKPAGQGLGLGLVISAKIVHEFGGTLVARSSDRGGMVFEFDLEQAGGEGDV